MRKGEAWKDGQDKDWDNEKFDVSYDGIGRI